MKLLLDEMYPAAIAAALRDKGHDVAAVQEEDALRELSDEAIFLIAQSRERAVVTENVPDFVSFDAQAHASDKPHFGLIFTTNRSFPRHRSGFVGALVRALDAFLFKQAGDKPTSLVHWLQPDDHRRTDR